MPGQLCGNCGALKVRGRCPSCAPARAARRARRRAPQRAVYKDWRWRGPNGTRRRTLERDRFRCVDCSHHDPSGRTLVGDHVPSLVELLALGLDPFDERHCRTRCLWCSGRKDGGCVRR